MVCVRKRARLAPSLKGWLCSSRGDVTSTDTSTSELVWAPENQEPKWRMQQDQWVRTDESSWNSCHLWEKKSTLKCDLARSQHQAGAPEMWALEDLMTAKGGWAAEPRSISFRDRRAAGNLGLGLASLSPCYPPSLPCVLSCSTF